MCRGKNKWATEILIWKATCTITTSKSMSGKRVSLETWYRSLAQVGGGRCLRTGSGNVRGGSLLYDQQLEPWVGHLLFICTPHGRVFLPTIYVTTGLMYGNIHGLITRVCKRFAAWKISMLLYLTRYTNAAFWLVNRRHAQTPYFHRSQSAEETFQSANYLEINNRIKPRWLNVNCWYVGMTVNCWSLKLALYVIRNSFLYCLRDSYTTELQ